MAQVSRKQARLEAVASEREAWASKLVGLAQGDWRASLRADVDALHRALLVRARATAKASGVL